MENKNKEKPTREVALSLTKHSAEKVARGLAKALPGDKVTIEALDATLCINIKNSKNTIGNWNSFRCWLKGLIPFIHSGHNYLEIEKLKNKNITISKCETCDRIDISWE